MNVRKHESFNASSQKSVYMTLSLIVAASENDVIGIDGTLPWRLSTDLQRFKRLTTGNRVLMGRTTHESIIDYLGTTLPEREHLVVTRNRDYPADGILVAHTIEEALERAQETDTYVIGGEQIYFATMGHVDRIYLTRVHTLAEGDAHFPGMVREDWQLVGVEAHGTGPKDDHPFTFEDYTRR